MTATEPLCTPVGIDLAARWTTCEPPPSEISHVCAHYGDFVDDRSTRKGWGDVRHLVGLAFARVAGGGGFPRAGFGAGGYPARHADLRRLRSALPRRGAHRRRQGPQHGAAQPAALAALGDRGGCEGRGRDRHRAPSPRAGPASACARPVPAPARSGRPPESAGLAGRERHAPGRQRGDDVRVGHRHRCGEPEGALLGRLRQRPGRRPDGARGGAPRCGPAAIGRNLQPDHRRRPRLPDRVDARQRARHACIRKAAVGQLPAARIRQGAAQRALGGGAAPARVRLAQRAAGHRQHHHRPGRAAPGQADDDLPGDAADAAGEPCGA